MEEITIQEIRNFNRFYTQILGLLDRHIVQSPFTLPEARVLYELNACQPATATLLAEKLGMDKGLLSRILSAFEKKKMLCKLPNSEDGRSRFVQLTQEGKTAFEAINMAANRQIMGLLSGKSVAQKKQIVEAMHSLRRVLADQTSGKDDHSLDDIHIRTDLQPGDLGALIQMHAKVYQDEYDYGIAFESYVAQGVAEFYQSYDPEKSRIWIAEHRGVRVGYLALHFIWIITTVMYWPVLSSDLPISCKFPSTIKEPTKLHEGAEARPGSPMHCSDVSAILRKSKAMATSTRA